MFDSPFNSVQVRISELITTTNTMRAHNVNEFIGIHYFIGYLFCFYIFASSSQLCELEVGAGLLRK